MFESGDSTTTVHGLVPERLHARYAPRIRRQIRATLGPDDEHEDLVQDVFVIILGRIDTLRDPACLDGWIAKITANTLKYNLRRRRLRRHASYETLPESDSPTSHPNVQARELASRAMDVLRRLPASERKLLSSYWFSSDTVGSIAAETGRSAVTVQRRLTKARTRFEMLARRDPALASCLDGRRRRGEQTSSPKTARALPLSRH